ncbi:MAG: choice-of-anchor D domain-containing protein [Bacteroidetes bacterium]|nr:choice-of-anchor D domain-containing protein [Bacteroidota bacterium]
MKSFVKVLFTILFASVLAFPIQARTLDAKTEAIRKKIKDADRVLNNTAQGREFWLAVPLNDVKAQPTLQLEFYVTSSYNTLVTMEVPGTGFIRSKKLLANEVVIFTTKDGSATYDFEIVSSQVADPRGIHITADQAISVYVMNGKQVTSDGYLALPVNTWGTEYIHCAYYDYAEFRNWGAGFIVVASEDKTEVNITLRGVGGGTAKTRSGSKIGEVLGPIILNKGEVYNVVGDATTRGQFDLTGSRITANKPIGLISYHERTMLPVNNTDGRDHMCEMVPPVSAWGKKYVSIELQRDNKGDFFRVVASKANTRMKMRYYDKVSKELLGQRDYILSKAGDFYEDFNTWIGNGAVVAFNGITVWEADKPILVMQYSYSANWDKGSDFDPFMIILTPQEQYLKATVFQTPVNENFVNNYFSYIVEGDTADLQQKKLKSLTIDGDTVYKTYSKLLSNNVPGTNLYWGRKTVTPGPHIVTSNTLFGGYIYGFGTFNSYGWPAALATRSLTDLDTLPPVLTFVENCGDYTYHATELRDYGPPPPDSVQIDQGIFDIYIVDSVSYNYELKLLTAEKVIPLPKVTKFDFKLLVKDKSKDAFAVLVVLDRAGNYTLDTVRYVSDNLQLNPAITHFGRVRVGTTKQLTVQLKNPNNKDVIVTAIKLKKNSEFNIIKGDSVPFTLKALDSHAIILSYKPIKEGKTDQDPDIDIDSLIAETTCGKFPFPVKGRGVMPCADIEARWNAGSVVVGTDTSFKERQTGRGLYIRNKGTDTLTVTDVKGVRLPFFIINQKPSFPFKVAPGGEVLLTSVGFAPSAIEPDSITVTFVTDGGGTDCNETSLWRGEGKAPGPVITPFDWQKRRVMTVNTGEVYIYNLGSSDLNLTTVELQDKTDPNFKIIGTVPTLPFILRPLDKGGIKLVVNVEYTPQTEATHHNLVVPTFIENVPPQTDGTLDGIGILPKIIPVGYTFTPCAEVGTKATPDGFVTITNPSTSADLNLKGFSINAAGPNIADFTFVMPTIPQIIPMGGTLKVPVSFTPTGVGRRFVVVDIQSDAAPGPEVDPTVKDTVHVVGCGFSNVNTEPRISVTSIDYGTVLTCDQPAKQFVIANPGGTAPLVITGYDVVGPDAAAFSVIGFVPPFSIAPNGTQAFDVQFKPTNNQPYNAQILIYSSNLTDTVNQFPISTRTVNLTGVGKIVPVEFAISPDINAGEKINAGKSHTFTLKATNGEWTGAPIKDFVAQVSFDEKHYKFTSADFTAAYTSNGWKFNVNPPVESGTGKSHMLTLDASGPAAIPANGDIIKLKFVVLLADTIHYPMGLDVQTPKLTPCVIPKSIPTEVTIEGCFINARLIKSSGTAYSLTSVSPNPATNNDITINYSVGLTARTTFELYNSLGEHVATLMDEQLNPGTYQANIPLTGIPSGVYLCRMISGQFTQSQTITITK